MGNSSSLYISRSWWARGTKRIVDLAAAAVLLLVVSPLMLLIALLIKLSSPGPVLFVQERAGRNGRNFRLMKFRTMRPRKPDPLELVPLSHPDITPVGRLLRRTKLDELPQLFNVLAGQMSLVGPRPTLPDQVAGYDEFRRQRLLVRPGVTGLAQVHGGTGIPWDQRILFDIAYVRRCRFSLDLWILYQTVIGVFRGQAAMVRRFEHTNFARWVDVPEGYERNEAWGRAVEE